MMNHSSDFVRGQSDLQIELLLRHDAMSPPAIHAMRQSVPTVFTLRELDLSMSSPYAQASHRELCGMLPNMPLLQKLCLYGLDLTRKDDIWSVCMALSALHGLTEISLWCCKGGDTWVGPILQILGAHRHLKKVSLCHSGITGKGISSILPSLRSITFLHELSLDGNPLGDPGILALLPHLRQMLLLMRLSLNRCSIPSVSLGANKLGWALLKLPELVKLALSGNDMRPALIKEMQRYAATGPKRRQMAIVRGPGLKERMTKLLTPMVKELEYEMIAVEKKTESDKRTKKNRAQRKRRREKAKLLKAKEGGEQKSAVEVEVGNTKTETEKQAEGEAPGGDDDTKEERWRPARPLRVPVPDLTAILHPTPPASLPIPHAALAHAALAQAQSVDTATLAPPSPPIPSVRRGVYHRRGVRGVWPRFSFPKPDPHKSAASTDSDRRLRYSAGQWHHPTPLLLCKARVAVTRASVSALALVGGGELNKARRERDDEVERVAGVEEMKRLAKVKAKHRSFNMQPRSRKGGEVKAQPFPYDSDGNPHGTDRLIHRAPGRGGTSLGQQ
ncbi:hypothetical protein KIPB_003003 [Kipferlia bialata]|uniref:Uncharacterized protein n=1 Tax=Kipferlia bialata TaxID=797122 RepID=A0A391NST3_9EUKA|nr:hypothetical protein KIPB_003003 [Kipferlia bialata]|eukprot:g3003.t1